MKFRIGYRTVKTALGASIAIMIAQMAGLDNYVSAGILTILCVKVTKKDSLRASWDRIFACILALIIASLLFELLAYHPLIIGLVLLLFIPTAVMLKASDGIVTSAVIIIHIYAAEQVTAELIVNELGIILIGVGVALLANLYMPSLDIKLKEYQVEIEQNFKRMFDEIVIYLRTNESNWDGREITETYTLIEEAKALAFREVENHVLRNESLYYSYFKMREKQFEIIEHVLPIVTSIDQYVEQAETIADFIEELSENIHPGNTASIFINKLHDMRAEFAKMELPKTREEFEARADLLYFTKEMEEYLIIKSKFAGLKGSRKMNQTKAAGEQ
ncbi:uncharacterized membrane protein YgaE (UPF0421/DUF939 family) [Cytobacillus horneckiae]|uniref:Aromatic acid exporter family protein n=1 Tax=Cytobacillus horneckiae TaxID=549687 RepID=A0A2N0Z9P4_9BACI|nr:aromatic acid exporter family protein [Cytobacillus horneckiae]NRG46641.1 aromatic acid exporter family protein [Bacillus sp. CRN 9]MBN6888790.1 aromatic acid exporter family protein [Cytobacillus horneckiae]MEC1155419.1 aromatic acid exporter family protein [Cytobacillus horneckiae]MED2936529.1 aromatic acid exporter family protein [Cytobacillus horneckiae]PKG26235.1 aromatic acid exporter family protein [Cytobacillus horneckiae]